MLSINSTAIVGNLIMSATGKVLDTFQINKPKTPPRDVYYVLCFGLSLFLAIIVIIIVQVKHTRKFKKDISSSLIQDVEVSTMLYSQTENICKVEQT